MNAFHFPHGSRYFFAVVVLLLCSETARGSFSPPSQVAFSASAYGDRAKLVNCTGASSIAAYANAGSGSANLYSYDVNYSVPLVSLLGRSSTLNLGIAYNSKVWVKSGSSIYFDGEQSWPAPGWRLGFGRVDGVYAGSDGYNHYYYIGQTGDIHDLRYNSGDGLYESTDSTYIDFNDSTGVLRLPSGTQITFALQGGSGGYVLATQVKDRNGNYITISYSGTGQQISSLVDTIGRTISFSYNGDGTLGSISKSGFGGGSRTWSFGYTSVSLAYSFASSLTVSAPASAKFLTSVLFPNGTKQAFSYNGYGQLTEADTESTSSSIRRKFLTTWNAAPGGGWTNSPTPTSISNFDGNNTNTWSLSFGSYSTSVTDPASVVTTTSFVDDPGNWDDGLPSQTQIGSTALKTTTNTWGSDTGSINPHITQVLTTLNDTNQQAQTQTDFTSYGNPAEVREYDWGLSLVRKTDYTYVNGSSYLNLHILNLPLTVIVRNGSGTAKSYTSYSYDGASLTGVTGAPGHDDTDYGTGFTYRGLMTSVTQYTDPVTPSGGITHSNSYDTLGNLRIATADCCVQQQYNFSSATEYSQPDSIVSGSGTTLTTNATYDSYTGLLASSTDENGATTTFGYDVADRRTSSTRADTTQIVTSYDDSSAMASSTVTTPVTSSNTIKRQTLFDGLGHPTRVILMDGNNDAYSKTDTEYDGLGRILQISLPYTGSAASYWTQQQYDALGRATKVIPPDGSSSSNNVTDSYSGNAVISTDQAGHQSKSKYDALGRQIEVDEPDPTNGNSLTLATTYSYDPMDNLTQVSEGVQTRSYVFDGLSRMIGETSPEAGTVSFQYNGYGKVTQRTDARGVITSYTYDTSLNRLTGVSYNVSGTSATSTPSVGYTYGTSQSLYNNGKLITMSDGLGSESYTYDQLGRQTQVKKVVYNVGYTTSYSFDLAGHVTQITYPSGRVVDMNRDDGGRVVSVQNHSSSMYYASSSTYNQANQVSAFSYGNGVAASYGYSASRMQLSSLSYSIGGSTLFGLNYSYSQGGNDNGEIASITDDVTSSYSASYNYDALGRLVAASNGVWGLSWTYDRYGNRTAQTVTSGAPPSDTPLISTSTNQITSMAGSGFSYDASGNLIQDDLLSYTFDAENRLVSLIRSGTTLATYAYDGNSMRVVKVWGASRTFDIYAGSQLISEFTDASSNTYGSGTSPQGAPADSVSLVMYHHGDHLATRYTTDQNANFASAQATYPFGELWYQAGTTYPSVEQKFATYPQDGESGGAQLEYALAREHTARLGRFYTTDPLRGHTRNPQSLNRYAYATDDPINSGDPSGRDGDLECDPIQLPTAMPGCPTTDNAGAPKSVQGLPNPSPGAPWVDLIPLTACPQGSMICTNGGIQQNPKDPDSPIVDIDKVLDNSIQIQDMLDPPMIPIKPVFAPTITPGEDPICIAYLVLPFPPDCHENPKYTQAINQYVEMQVGSLSLGPPLNGGKSATDNYTCALQGVKGGGTSATATYTCVDINKTELSVTTTFSWSNIAAACSLPISQGFPGQLLAKGLPGDTSLSIVNCN